MTSNAKRDALAEQERIYEPKYGGKDHSGYDTLMKYEVNDEREECFIKGWDAREAEVAELQAEIKLQRRELEALSNSVNTYDKINDSLKQQVETLKSEARLHNTIVTQLQRGHTAQLKTRDEAINAIIFRLNEMSTWYTGSEGAGDLFQEEIIDLLTKINTLLGREKE